MKTPREGQRVVILECGTNPPPGSVLLPVGTVLTLCGDAREFAGKDWLQLPLVVYESPRRAWTGPVKVGLVVEKP